MTDSQSRVVVLPEAGAILPPRGGLEAMARRRYQQGYVFFKNGQWWGRYYESVLLSDGSERRVRRQPPLGKHATEKLARRALEPFLAKVNASSYRPLRNTTWRDFSEQWRTAVLPAAYKPSVQSSVKSQLRALSWFDRFKVADITAFTIQQFIAQRGQSSKTIKNDVGQMRSMWKQATKWGYAQHNPFDGVVIPNDDTEERPEEPCYTVEEVRSIIAASPHPYDLVWWTAAEAGIRRGELCGLNCGDLETVAIRGISEESIAVNIIAVRRSRWGKHLTRPKSGKLRQFPVSDALAAALRNYVGNRGKDEPLFLSAEGCRLHPENLIKRVLKPILAQLGISGASHAFRHGNITEMDRIGVPMAVRQSRVGHADQETTMRYTHVVSADARIAAEALGKLYAPADLASMKPHGGTQ